VFSQMDITGYNYNILPTYASDHQQLPKRLMLTTESYPSKAFPLWQITQDHSYVLGDFTWTAMDYLGESGIGAWSYGTPEQAKMAEQMMGSMLNTSIVDKLFLGMANGVDMMTAVTQGTADPATTAAMAALFHGFPWHASACGDLDLTGFRKPQSYYREILWNGGDLVYATVRLPEPEGKRIIAVGWATYPTLATWSWAGQEGKDLQVEVYSGAERVRLFLNDQLIGEKPTGREQEFKATFSVPYSAGTLKAVGMRGEKPVAESILETSGEAAGLRVTADRTVVQADGQDLSYLVVEAVDKAGRYQPHADQEIRFSINGPGVIAAVGNGDGQDENSYQSDRRRLFDGRALVVVRTARQSGSITVKAQAPGLSAGSVTIRSKAIVQWAELP
jgi:beta-galactosidase